MIPVTLRNGWQKEEKDAGKILVWRDKRYRALTCVFCRVIYLTLICSVFFFYKKICVKDVDVWWKVFSKQNYCHAFQTKFAVLFPSRPVAFVH